MRLFTPGLHVTCVSASRARYLPTLATSSASCTTATVPGCAPSRRASRPSARGVCSSACLSLTVDGTSTAEGCCSCLGAGVPQAVEGYSLVERVDRYDEWTKNAESYLKELSEPDVQAPVRTRT